MFEVIFFQVLRNCCLNKEDLNFLHDASRIRPNANLWVFPETLNLNTSISKSLRVLDLSLSLDLRHADSQELILSLLKNLASLESLHLRGSYLPGTQAVSLCSTIRLHLRRLLCLDLDEHEWSSEVVSDCVQELSRQPPLPLKSLTLPTACFGRHLPHNSQVCGGFNHYF